MYTINPNKNIQESLLLDELANKYVRRKLIIKEINEFSRVKSQTENSQSIPSTNQQTALLCVYVCVKMSVCQQ